MKDYRRMMEQVTLSDRKKEEIMDMLENKGTKKRQMTTAKKLVLVTALAVGCVLSIAAGLPGQVYNFFSGGSVNIMPAGADGAIGGADATFGSAERNAPIILEDGKLWFVNGDERTDLTGLIDENTPYIYEHTDPATGNKGYVIVGGTVDHFGWAEYFDAGNMGTWRGNGFDDTYLTIDGVRQSTYQMTPELMEKVNNDPSYEMEIVKRPWFESAMKQLGAF